MKGNKIAVRYAKALLELAADNNKVDQIAADMKYLLKVNTEAPDFQILLQSPVVNSDKKITIFSELFHSFDKISMMFIELITKKRRENLLAEIADAFESLVNEKKGIVPVTIISATALHENTKKEIVNKIKSSTKGELLITEVIDASLIGGFIVKMNDKQIDASIASQFNNLKQR